MKPSALFASVAALATTVAPLPPAWAQNVPAVAAAAPKAPKPVPQFVLLTESDLPPDQVLPAPPAKGSQQEALELAQLRSLIAGTSPERLVQARWDADHEDPSIFDAVLEVKLESLPATWELLRAVQNDANIAASRAKARYARTRPWGVDPRLPNCDAGTSAKPTNSYPSGHASLGYSVGFMLAALVPAKASAILARASDYSLSRQICGVHFPSDGEASHVIGSIVATRFLLAPQMAGKVAAARAELARVTGR